MVNNGRLLTVSEEAPRPRPDGKLDFQKILEEFAAFWRNAARS